MTSIIITIILNILLGNPTDTNKDLDTTTDKDSTTTVDEKKDDSMSLMGGSGTWTTIEK